MNFKEFINQHKYWIKPVITLFIVSIFAGSAAAFYYPELMQQIANSFAQEFGETPALDINLAKKIFLQNVTASAIAWLGGILLAIAPVIIVLVNGFILGYVITFITLYSGNVGESVGLLSAGLIPHAIFEIPAFLAAAVLGLRLGLSWLTEEAKGQRLKILKTSFIITARYFLFVVLALVAAAIIEVFVSGKLVENL